MELSGALVFVREEVSAIPVTSTDLICLAIDSVSNVNILSRIQLLNTSMFTTVSCAETGKDTYFCVSWVTGKLGFPSISQGIALYTSVHLQLCIEDDSIVFISPSCSTIPFPS